MVNSWRMYVICGALALLFTGLTLYHFYDKGRAAAEKQQTIARQKVIAKNRKADVKIDRQTPAADKRAAIEWLLQSTRQQ